MDVIGLLPLVGIALVFWLLIIRPASRRNKQMRALQSGLSTGDEVMLTSGFYGTVRGLGDDRVEVELAPGTVVWVARAAIGSVVPAADPADPADPTEPTESTEPADEARDERPPADPEER